VVSYLFPLLLTFLVLMQVQVDFDDKSSWEYLFKDYWIDLKEKLSLTLDELNHAKNPWKVADSFAGKQESPDELYDANNDEGSDSDSSGNIEISNSKRRRAKKRLRPRSKEADSAAPATAADAEGPSTDDNAEWASKELLEFVMHMKDGDRSVLSQFDVQALLLDYIKRNKLRDPRRKSQIICDLRLQSLFGKPRVGHFEMLKLLESHFLIKEDSQVDDLQGSVVDTEASQLETDADALVKTGRDKKRKTRKKGDERGPQSNVDDYAAIDNHNINLIYLRRNLVEELLDDMEKFHDKVVGSFVRIRISGSGQKQDLYRLVQVIGNCLDKLSCILFLTFEC
jgi:chromatin remodeling complex protein RSC6